MSTVLDELLGSVRFGDSTVSRVSGNPNAPYDSRTHNTVNEITALDPQGGVGSFNLDWGEGSEQEREYNAGDSAWEPRRQYVEGGQYIDEHLTRHKALAGKSLTRIQTGTASAPTRGTSTPSRPTGTLLRLLIPAAIWSKKSSMTPMARRR